MATTEENRHAPGAELGLRRFLLRSLLPLAALLLILSTALLGPFGFAAAVIAWWLVQRRF